MGCAPSRPTKASTPSRPTKPRTQSRPTKPSTQSRPTKPIPQPKRPTNQARKNNNSRLSRPFDSDVFLSQYDQSSSHKANQTVRPVGPERYGDAYAQLNARSKQTRGQTGRKDQKVQFAQGPRVKSQAAQQFKGDTLYFSS